MTLVNSFSSDLIITVSTGDDSIVLSNTIVEVCKNDDYGYKGIRMPPDPTYEINVIHEATPEIVNFFVGSNKIYTIISTTDEWAFDLCQLVQTKIGNPMVYHLRTTIYHPDCNGYFNDIPAFKKYMRDKKIDDLLNEE